MYKYRYVWVIFRKSYVTSSRTNNMKCYMYEKLEIRHVLYGLPEKGLQPGVYSEFLNEHLVEK